MENRSRLTTRFLKDSLAALAIAAAVLAANAADVEKPTFTENVAPILMKRCVSCHRPGEIAPMSLLTYDEARPWAKSIREAILSRKMPPWHADPSYGHFSNDISLSQGEIDTIVRWVDQGARKGDPSKMPAAPKFSEGWKLGEPDYVLEMGTIDVPASGPDVFLDRHVRLDLPEDRWVRAVEIRPGNKQVLHHLVSFIGYIEMSGTGGGQSQRRSGGNTRQAPRVFSIWAAGTPPTIFPDGMGHSVAKNQELTFNIHIHPNGQATTDHSTVGIYFGKGTLEKNIKTGFAANPGILIPAGADNVESSASYVFRQDSRIISFFPHMHLRGKEMSFTLTHPDGRREILLNVPRYDFNWQWIYYPEKAINVAAGSRIDVVGRWDNSPSNRNNPDPTRAVEFAEGTDSEMLVGFFDYVVNEGSSSKSAQERIDVLLAPHPAQFSYFLEVPAGFTIMNWGLHLPKEGTGTFYLMEGDELLTITLRDIIWNGSEVTMRGKLIRGAGSTIPMGIRANVADSGEISGKIYIGAVPTAGAEPKGPVLAFTGKRRSEARTAAAP